MVWSVELVIILPLSSQSEKTEPICKVSITRRHVRVLAFQIRIVLSLAEEANIVAEGFRGKIPKTTSS